MRKAIEEIDGFISVERFQSIVDDGKLLSLSFFETHEALDEWRNLAEHRVAQQIGRTQFFADYRLRIAHIERDSACQTGPRHQQTVIQRTALRGNAE